MEKSWNTKGVNSNFGTVDSIKLVRQCADDLGQIFTNETITHFGVHKQFPVAYWTEEKLDEFAAEKLIQNDMDNFPDANKPIPE